MALDEIAQSIDRAWLAKFIHNGRVKNTHRNSTYPSGSSWFHYSYGFVFRVRGLLAAGADPTTLNAQGKTPLDLARETRHVEVANYINWEHGAIVHTLADCLGRPPVQMEIYAAAAHKRMRRFRFYVRRLIERASSEFLTAARTGDLLAVRVMIEHGEICVDMMDKATGETGFSLALANGHRHVCVWLMEKGARIDGLCLVKGEPHPILVAAVLTGDVDFVRRVVAHDASVLRPTKGDTSKTCAVVEAIKMGSIEMMEALLDLGAPVDRTKIELDLPRLPLEAQYSIVLSDPVGAKEQPWLLLCAACWFRDKPLFEYLLRTRPRLQDFVANPRNAAAVLFFAVYSGDEQLTKEILRRGASVNQPFSNNITALAAAAVTNSTSMLQLLIDHGGDVLVTSRSIIKGSYGDDALLTAAISAGAMDCAQMLLPLETRTHHRSRALLWAAIRGEVEFAARLLEDAPAMIEHRALLESIRSTSCPLVLDLLLTRYSENEGSIAEMNNALAWACQTRKSADLLAVFVAHGADVTRNVSTVDSGNSTSPIMEIVLHGWKSLPCVSTLGFVLKNGMPIVTTNRGGHTPEQEMKGGSDQLSGRSTRKSELFADCREIIAAFSSS